MRIIGGEFVVGRTIEEALQRSADDAQLQLCSFDMLGEGARTLHDADRYLHSYEHAIDAIGNAVRGGAPHEPCPASRSSCRRSQPRYALTQKERVAERLVPKAIELARRAAAAGIQLTIDAEEADRLDLSLDVIEALARDRTTEDWPGLGLAIQAYGKRTLDVIEWVAALARGTPAHDGAPVKGAYWDSEIKRSQERGLDGYPVYTRKLTTDVSYLACAGKLLRASRPHPCAVRDAQCAQHRVDPRRQGGAGKPAVSSSSACTAWAGCCSRRRRGRSRTFRAYVSTLPSASTRTCSPTWSAGCWRTAPIRRS